MADMAKIVGNVRPEDDYTHPLGPETNFNESVYFNFFDREQRRGGFVRIGNRANEGYAELTVIVYDPEGSALFNYKCPASSCARATTARSSISPIRARCRTPARRSRRTHTSG